MYLFHDKTVTFNFYLARWGNFLKKNDLGWSSNIYEIPETLESKFT